MEISSLQYSSFMHRITWNDIFNRTKLMQHTFRVIETCPELYRFLHCAIILNVMQITMTASKIHIGIKTRNQFHFTFLSSFRARSIKNASRLKQVNRDRCKIAIVDSFYQSLQYLELLTFSRLQIIFEKAISVSEFFLFLSMYRKSFENLVRNI